MAVPNVQCAGTGTSSLFKQALLSSKPLQILKFHNNNSSTISSLLPPQSSAFSSSTNMLRCPFGLARSRRFNRYIFYSSAQGYSSFSGFLLGQKEEESAKGLHLKSKVRHFAFNIHETSHWIIKLSRFHSVIKSLNHEYGPSCFTFTLYIMYTHEYIFFNFEAQGKVSFLHTWNFCIFSYNHEGFKFRHMQPSIFYNYL